MPVSSFVNNPDESSFHTNQYAAGTSSKQSFNDRMQVDRNRQVVGAYRDSQLGANFLRQDYSELKRRAHYKPRDEQATEQPSMSRQAINAGEQYDRLPRETGPSSRQEANSRLSIPNRQLFHEPQSRGYNPYK